MGVVSFRIPDDDAAALRRAGVQPAAIAKLAVEAAARSLRVDEQMAIIARFARPAAEPVVQTIRKMREEHDARLGLQRPGKTRPG